MSSKAFQEPPLSYKPEGDPESPWLKAKGEWDQRIGSARLQAYNWRLFALLSMGLCILLTGGLIFQSTKSMVTPYVIEVDSTTGMARNVGAAMEQKYVPKEAEIRYFLGQFIQKTRSVPLDPVIMRQNWTAVNLFVNNNAANKMQTYLQSPDGPAGLLHKKTVQPTIISILAQSDNTYFIRWTEDTYDVGGGGKTSTLMNGTFTVAFSQPKDEKELMVNPLGLLVVDFDWRRENVSAQPARQ